MKINYPQLESLLRKPLGSLTLVSGEDLFLKEEALIAARQAAKRDGFHERLSITPDGESAWEQVHADLYTYSFLSEKKLIELNCCDALPSKKGAEILQGYAASPREDIRLIIILNKLDDKITRSHWYQALEKAGVVVCVWPIPPEQFPAWVTQRAKKYQITLLPDAARLLAMATEGNLLAAAQCIEKLQLLQCQQPIDAPTIDTLLSNEMHFSVFDLTESMVNQSPARSLKVLQSLQEEGIQPAIILWAITREVRLLIDMLQGVTQGSTYDALFQKHRVFTRRQPALRKLLSQCTMDQLHALLKQAFALDKTIKGATQADVWEGLQLFCMRFGIMSI
ncbi:MAG TPA: DNA polymerase III subunit delta [Gammaproteobacteria bacterium]|nr:DNA polymerase III subunit delta [Gammaproteobacteria bacterium]